MEKREGNERGVSVREREKKRECVSVCASERVREKSKKAFATLAENAL